MASGQFRLGVYAVKFVFTVTVGNIPKPSFQIVESYDLHFDANTRGFAIKVALEALFPGVLIEVEWHTVGLGWVL